MGKDYVGTRAARSRNGTSAPASPVKDASNKNEANASNGTLPQVHPVVGAPQGGYFIQAKSEVPLPTSEEVSVMLELLMEDLNLTDDKKEMMRNISDDRKWEILQQHLGDRYRDGRTEMVIQIQQEIKLLKDSPNIEHLKSLSVSLRSHPIRWINIFIENGGLKVLLENLRLLAADNTHNDFEEYYIKSLKSLMNNKVGLASVVESEGALNVIAVSLRSPSFRTKSLVLEILGAVCLIPGGHQPVLDAIDSYCEVAMTRYRFETVVYTLWQSCQGAGVAEKELQVSCMSFINAVICGGPGLESLEFRMHMRMEFLQVGLMQLIDKIGFLDNELLQTQIDVWISGLETDEEELWHRLGFDEPKKFDTLDEVTGAVSELMKTSASYLPYVSLHRNLLLLPSEPLERMKYMYILDQIVQQIVLQQPDGSHPDPANVLTEFDITKHLPPLMETDKQRSLEDKYKVFLEKSKRLEKELTQTKADLENQVKSVNLMATNPEQFDLIEKQIKQILLSIDGGRDLYNRFETKIKELRAAATSPNALKALQQQMQQQADNLATAQGGVPTPPGGAPGVPPPPGAAGIPPPPPPPPGAAGIPPPPPPPPGMGGPPPPPPPPGMGGPPPPPPPPGMGGPPPPPMFGKAAGPPAKKTNLSSKPLKAFNWTKMPVVKVKDTVWGDINEEEVHKKLKGKAYEQFEDLFAAQASTFNKKEANTTSSDSLQEKKEITFLDAKRAQNCNIMLKAIKIDAATVKNAIDSVNTQVLTKDTIVELLKFIPTEDEIYVLKKYDNDVENLAPAEYFLHKVSGIVKYEEKLKALNTMAGFSELDDDLQAELTWLKGSCEDVLDSKKWQEVLKVILALGNYMNAGQRGGAYGFKLNSLLKMVDTKSGLKGRKVTLLNYLSDLLNEEFPDIKDFPSELSHVEDGAKISIAQIRQSLISMRDSLKQVNNLIEFLHKDKSDHSGIKFKEAISKFWMTSDKIYADLDKRFKEGDKLFEKAVIFYGEDPKTSSPEDFFGTINKFVQAYVLAKKENDDHLKKLADSEKKEREKLEREERLKKKRENGGNNGGNEEGGLDDLISAIKTGKAFGGADNSNRVRKTRAAELSKEQQSSASIASQASLSKVTDTNTAKKDGESTEKPGPTGKKGLDRYATIRRRETNMRDILTSKSFI